MVEIIEVLEKEKEKEKENLVNEFEEKKSVLENFWKEEIEKINKEYKLILEQKIKDFLDKEREKKEIEIFCLISLEKQKLIESFVSKAINILKNLDNEDKNRIYQIALEEFKNNFEIKKNGKFVVEKGFLDVFKANFPDVEIEESDNLVFGFKYEDEKIEVIFTPESVLEIFCQNYNFF